MSLDPPIPGSSGRRIRCAIRLEKLQKLGELYASGVLTDAEFAAQKAKLLGEI